MDRVRQRLLDYAETAGRRSAEAEAWLAVTAVDELVCRAGRVERRGSAERSLATVTVWRGGREGSATGDLTSDPGDLIDASLAIGAALPDRDPLPAGEPWDGEDVHGSWPTVSAAAVNRLAELCVSDDDQEVELRFRVERRRVGVLRSGGTPRLYTGGFVKLRMRVPTVRDSRRGFAVEELYGHDVADVIDRAADGGVAAVRATSCTLASAPVAELHYDGVLLDGGVVTELMYSLGAAFRLDSVRSGLSDLGKYLGEQLAMPAVGLADDLNDPRSPLRLPWDDEGTRLERADLIRDGVVVAFLADRRTALEAGTDGSTGAGWRDIEGGNVAVRPGCLVLTPAAPIEPGGPVVKVVQANGALSVNNLTGDFTVGADAVLVEGAGPDRNVGRITLAGNLFAILRDLRGHDGRWYVRQWGPTFYASPGVYVDTVTIRR